MAPRAKKAEGEGGRRLATNVTVVVPEGQPDAGNSVTYGPDDELPDWFDEACTNPDVWESEDPDAASAAPEE